MGKGSGWPPSQRRCKEAEEKRELHMRTVMQPHHTSVRTAKTHKTGHTKCWSGETGGHSGFLGVQTGQPLCNSHFVLSYKAKQSGTQVFTQLCSKLLSTPRMFMAASFIVTKSWKRCLSVGEWTNKRWQHGEEAEKRMYLLAIYYY